MDPREGTDPGVAFNERTAAFVLDTLVLGGAAYGAGGGGWAGLGALAAVSLVNQGVLAGLTGYSLGKAITGVRVARADGTDPPGIAGGLVRWLLLLFVDMLLLGLVGLVVAGRSSRRQRVGDIVARTWVIGLAPSPRARAGAGAALVALCLALLFVASPPAGWAVTAVFVPVAAGVAVIVAGVSRRRAPWPWLVGLGVALVPACWTAFVRVCDKVAGTCISGEELTSSKQAIVSVIAFAIAIAVLLVARSRARDAVFQVLVLFGQLWLVLKLVDSGERPETVMVVGLIVLELVWEAVSRVRAARERAAESRAVAA